MNTKSKSISLGLAKTQEKIIPRSWLYAFGLLKKKKINALGYQKRKRFEWAR